MSPLVETIAFVFGLVALGYVSGWTGLLHVSVGDALSAFAVAIAVPVLLFRTMVNADFSGAAQFSLWACYFTGVAVTWTAGQLTATHVFGRDARASVVGGIAAAFSNLVLVGTPFMLGVYGQEGFEILSLIISVHLPIMMAASIILFAWADRERLSPRPLDIARNFLTQLLSNPLIVGILAGLSWRLTGIPMPALGERFVDGLADVAGPVALFAVGLGMRKFNLSGNIAAAFGISALKLFLLPAVALVMAKLTGLPPLSAKVVVAAAAMPTGVNPYLVAIRFGTGQALASNTMTVATGCAVVTTAFWLSVAEWVF